MCTEAFDASIRRDTLEMAVKKTARKENNETG